MLPALGKRRVAKSSHTTSSATNHNQPPTDDDLDPNSKSKDAPIKVILSLFGLMVVVFIMFSVFTPENRKGSSPDRPQLKVLYDKKKFHDAHKAPALIQPHFDHDLDADPLLNV